MRKSKTTMLIFLGLIILLVFSIGVSFTSAKLSFSSVYASDVSGNPQTSFVPGENVYATVVVSGATGDTPVRIYVVRDVPDRTATASITDIRGAFTTATFTDTDLTELAWAGVNIPGEFFIIVDRNEDGLFNDGDVASSIVVPLAVVPEYALGGLAALGACLVGLVVFKKRSSLRFA